jgi:Fe-S-cluster containining protein
VSETNCTCQVCQNACASKPGHFAPGEAEKAAALVGLSLKAFFDAHLAVDWWEDSPNVFYLSPAAVGNSTGEEWPANPRGACVFFVDGRCAIYAARPGECRRYLHGMTREQTDASVKTVVDAWRAEEHQQQIRDLLGREPQSEEYSIFDAWSWR